MVRGGAKYRMEYILLAVSPALMGHLVHIHSSVREKVGVQAPFGSSWSNEKWKIIIGFGFFSIWTQPKLCFSLTCQIAIEFRHKL